MPKKKTEVNPFEKLGLTISDVFVYPFTYHLVNGIFDTRGHL